MSDDEKAEWTNIDEYPAVVVDNGSYQIKAGFAQGDEPSAVFPNVVSRKKKMHSGSGASMIGTEDSSIGYGATKTQLSNSYPIKKGFVEHWDDMELIWKHTYKKLRVEPEERAAIFTEPPLNEERNREKIANIMFEKFDIPAFYLTNTCTPGLYSYGRTTGVVIDSGYEITRCVPIYEGFPMPNATKTCDMGGYDITLHLLEYLRKSGDYSNLFGYPNANVLLNEIKRVRAIKEKLCFVPLDYDEAMQKGDRTKYELPDGTRIILNEARFECGEALFTPKLLRKYKLGSDDLVKSGAHILVNDAVREVWANDEDIAKELYQNITAIGGNTMFQGFVEKLKGKLVDLVSNDNIEIKVIGLEERKYSSWIGCAIISGLSTFEEMWIQKEEYDEEGPRIVLSKCCM